MFPVDKALPEIAGYTKRLRDKAKSYGKIFEQTYADINAFASISNGLVLTLELIDYYYERWWKEEGRQYLRDQDTERIVTICKWAYIHTFSIIEYISKELVKRKNCEKFEKINQFFAEGKRVKFLEIMEISSHLDLVDKQQKKVWDSLREIRNTFVHNNAINDKDGRLEYKFKEMPKPYILEYKRGESLEGNLLLGLKLIEIIIELYYEWVQKVIQMNRSK